MVRKFTEGEEPRPQNLRRPLCRQRRLSGPGIRPKSRLQAAISRGAPRAHSRLLAESGPAEMAGPTDFTIKTVTTPVLGTKIEKESERMRTL